jgi:hypothetical protein
VVSLAVFRHRLGELMIQLNLHSGELSQCRVVRWPVVRFRVVRWPVERFRVERLSNCMVWCHETNNPF